MIFIKKGKIKDKTKSKERKKMLLCFGLGVFLTSIIGVGASTILSSGDVTYDNSSSGLSATTVQAALDELYEQAKSAPECDKYGTCTVTCPSGTVYATTATGYVCSNSSTTIKKLGATVVTSGDGLYVDSATSGRYIYRGSSVNNYITFNDETWRIMSVESDGTIKIIKDASIGTYAWDTKGTRSSSTSTYCTNASNYGCNAWAATTNLVGTPTDFTLHYPNGNTTSDTTTYSGTVTQDASLNTYLNGEYYNSLSTTAQSYITSHSFNVGTPGYYTDTEDIATDVAQEAIYKWNGKIGLMNITEFMRTTTSTSCTSLSAGNSSTSACSSNNWMFKSIDEWTLSPRVTSDSNLVWFVRSRGSINNDDANSHAIGVRPALYLKSSITLTGSGTSADPYTITAS